MALDQSALLDLLDVMRSADGGDLMRRLLATMLQLLVDASVSLVASDREDPDLNSPATPRRQTCPRSNPKSMAVVGL